MPAPIPVNSTLLLYPADRSAFQYTGVGEPILMPPVTAFVIFAEEACITPVDLYDTNGDGPLPYSTVYTDDTGLLQEFMVIDLTRVWAVAQVSGQTVPPYPLDAAFGPRIDELFSAISVGGPGGSTVNTIRNGDGPPSGLLGVDGDWYIDKTAKAIYGPKTAGLWGGATSLVGPQGIQGPPGSGSGGGSAYTHLQYGANQVWDIVHPLGYVPAVTTVDTGGTEIKGDVRVLSNSHLQVEFAFAFPGTAFLS